MTAFCLALSVCLRIGSAEALECYGCHGTQSTHDNRPEDASFRNPSSGGFQGNHRTHMVAGADSATCSKCHPRSANYSSAHSHYSKNKIKVSSRINNSPTTTHYPLPNRTSAFPQTFDKGATGPAPLGSCYYANCHFEKQTPAWGNPQLTQATSNCNVCHGAPPPDGKHTKHFSAISSATGRTPGNVCIKCHSDHVSEPNRFAHATSAGKRPLFVKFKVFPNTTGLYSGDVSYPHYLPSQSPARNGTCGNLYCHSNAAPFNKTNIFRTPTWSGAALTCTSCHDGAGSSTGLSGRHGKHTRTPDAASLSSAIGCVRCHFNTATGSSAIRNKTLHVNGTKDATFTQGRYSSTTRQCNNTYCHSDALGNPPTIPVKWSDTANPMKCYSCHKGRYNETDATINDNTQANCLATPGGSWSYAKNPLTGVFDVGVCTPFLTMTSNGHQRLVGPQWIRHYPCTFCHAGTITSVPQGSGMPPKDGALISNRHVNYSTNVVINPYWSIAGGFKIYSAPRYNPQTKVCNNVYCHSDGTIDPDRIKDFPWNWRENGVRKHAECNSCHGHPQGDCTTNCHDNKTKYLINNISSVLPYPQTGWSAADEWKSAMPMYANGGVGSNRANSHTLHVQGKKTISCSECHYLTIPSGDCTDCHTGATPSGMGETAHLNPAFHVNKNPEISFKQGGTYSRSSNKSCQSTNGTACHGSNTPKWGDSADNTICFNCHGSNGDAGHPAADTDNYAFSFKNSTAAKINMIEWKTTGHGRMSSAVSGPFGRYPSSTNPAANFPGNPCWYCHDSKVLHNYSGNPFRLKQHTQFSKRFDKECVYCHMQGMDVECLSCHNVDPTTGESLAPQLRNISSSGARIPLWPNYSSVHVPRPDHRPWQTTGGVPSCLSSSYNSTQCHYVDRNNSTQDVKLHNSGAGFWTFAQQADVKNQYMMMGVCLQCHDDDSNNKCTGCHTPPADNLKKYDLGYDPGTGYIKPKKARASSVHFGFKHYRESLAPGWGGIDANGRATGVWKGGKFCWDCHDPHGDTNIYMLHDNVATQTDGRFGIPKQRARVIFTQKVTGGDYAQKTPNASGPYAGKTTGICNVCHGTDSRHYQASGGDGHNSGTICTTCHEHRFTDSHAEGNPCNTCHMNKPVPRHSGFGLPLDCLKCHTGSVGNRQDVIGQFKGNSHHVQGTPITNRQCYQCHWESTPEGMIDARYHEGFNFNTYSTQKDKKVDLVIYGPGTRPTAYRQYSTSAGRATAVQFLAVNIGSGDINAERRDSAGVTNHCLGCHSDQNNFTKPFNDCKTPRQYSWDRQSVASRYSQNGTTKWGKYSSTTVNAKYKVTKALSAHGNASANQGGWDPATGIDSNINNYRPGFTGMSSARRNVQCFDCHNSHGSKGGIKTDGTLDPTYVSSSYISYSGLRNGGNLKEMTMGKGGYKVTYSSKANTSGNNPYNPGAGQCFDCHMTAMKAADWTSGTPWGFQSTFGASMPIKGYRDAYKFGDRNYTDPILGQVYKLGGGAMGFTYKQNKNIQGGHLKASKPLSTAVTDSINGLCTPCHDPHGVSTTLGVNQKFGVPLLKGTWMSSPYKEDFPPSDPTNATTASHPSATTGAKLSWGTANYQGNAGQWLNSPNSNTTDNAPPAKYNIDRNTFGTTSSTTGYGRGGSVPRISQTDAQFAGLCMICHAKKALMGRYTSSISGTSAYRPNQAKWSSVARVHASNSGWGTNKEHSFTCSKCHEPHNSGLPRLMQSNCLDYNHRGGRQSGGEPWVSRKTLAEGTGIRWYQEGNDQLRGYPIASIYGANTKGQSQYYGNNTFPIPAADAACHLTRPGTGITSTQTWPTRGSDNTTTPSKWPNANYWNKVTPW